MLRTLHLDTQSNWRGGQSQALLLLRGLIERGQSAELMAPRGSLFALRARGAGIIVHTVSPNFLRAGMAWTLGRLLRDRSSSGHFDVVHAHDSHALAAAWLAGGHRHAALIASRRVAYQLSKGRLASARYRSASCIIAISDFVARSMEPSGIDPSRVTIVHDGVVIPPAIMAGERECARNAARARWGVAESDCLLGCMSHLSPEKGQEVLLRALPMLAERTLAGGALRDCRLLLAGGGNDRARLEALARELRISDRVILTGFVDDVDSVFAGLDIFLFPSLTEPLGSSLLDAMARGLPCIAVASGGVPEVVEDGVNGILLSSSPVPAAFADAIVRLIGNPTEAVRIGAAARATIATRFSAARMIDATLAVYEEALAGERR